VVSYGWNEAAYDEPMLHFGDYVLHRSVEAVDVPPVVDFENQVGPGGLPILDNDVLGDCVPAGMYHSDQIWRGWQGSQAYLPTNNDAVSLYGSVAGYVPGVPSTDQGTDCPTAFNWWLSNPMPGSGTKLAAWFSVNPNDRATQKLALWLGGTLGVGFNVPYSAEQQFNQGVIWDTTRGRPNYVGGHYVPVVGMDSSWNSPRGAISAVPYKVATWGALQGMSQAFWNQNVQEVYALFGEPWVDGDGVASNNIDWATLNTDIMQMWGSAPFVDPGTGPTPPTPPVGFDAVSSMTAIKAVVENWSGQ